MNEPSKTNGETKFKEDLKTYFPDLYAFWSLFSFDPFYQDMMESVLIMVNTNGYGTIEIVYQKGKINYINLKKQVTAEKSNKPTKLTHE